MCILLPVVLCTGCARADTVFHNVQYSADNFNVYRRITFINLYTNEVLYGAEGYFSIKTSYENNIQQELCLVFRISDNEYKMDYFSVANNVTYVIEQIENTHTNPYYWDIYWYIPIPNVVV